MRMARFGVLIFFLLAAFMVYGDDYYVIDMNAYGAHLPGSCEVIQWASDTILYNASATDATVTLLGVSNGTLDPRVATTFTAPAARVTSLLEVTGGSWQPGPSFPSMWIEHLSVPPGTLVDSEMLPLRTNVFCVTGVVSARHAFGKVKLPVFRSLVPAGRQQIIPGLTLGDVAGHINVSVYNAGDSAGTAAIEIRRACDNSVSVARSVTVPANTVLQFEGFAIPDDAACSRALSGMDRLAYLTVTVDRPSLTYASILGAADVPVATIKDVPVSTIQVAGGVAQ